MSSSIPSGPLVVTNVPNLLHFWSHGYIGSRNAFSDGDKYFEDLLELSGGRLPIFSAPISEDVITYVSKESKRTARPVILELDASALPEAKVPGIDRDGNPVTSIPGDPECLMTAPGVALPFDSVRRLHFREPKDRDALKRPMFSNVKDFPDSFLQITPEVQGQTDLTLEIVQSWLSDLDQVESPSMEEFVQQDKTAGAAVMIDARHPGNEDDVFSALFDHESFGDGNAGIPTWIAMNEHNNESEANPDATLYRAAESTLRNWRESDWRPKEILLEVENRLSQVQLAESDRKNLDGGIRKIDRILKNEESFEGARSHDYPALQGLMFFLIRKDPESLLQWRPEDTNSSEEAHLASVAYSGLLYGRAKLPLKFRSEGLDGRLSREIARRLSPLSDRPRRDSIESSSGRPDLEKRLRSAMESAPLDSEGPVRQAALTICKIEEWTDCVTSTITSPDRSPVTTYITKKGGSNQKLKMAWKIGGFAQIEYKLDVQNFRRRLETESLSNEAIEQAVGLLSR
jgi:hypothetical protein